MKRGHGAARLGVVGRGEVWLVAIVGKRALFIPDLCSIPDVLLRIKDDRPRSGKSRANQCFFD